MEDPAVDISRWIRNSSVEYEPTKTDGMKKLATRASHYGNDGNDGDDEMGDNTLIGNDTKYDNEWGNAEADETFAANDYIDGDQDFLPEYHSQPGSKSNLSLLNQTYNLENLYNDDDHLTLSKPLFSDSASSSIWRREAFVSSAEIYRRHALKDLTEWEYPIRVTAPLGVEELHQLWPAHLFEIQYPKHPKDGVVIWHKGTMPRKGKLKRTLADNVRYEEDHERRRSISAKRLREASVDGDHALDY